MNSMIALTRHAQHIAWLHTQAYTLIRKLLSLPSLVKEHCGGQVDTRLRPALAVTYSRNPPLPPSTRALQCDMAAPASRGE